MIRGCIFCLLLAVSAGAQELAAPFNFSFSENPQGSDPDYEKGLSNLDARRWEAAVANFDSAARNKSLADASLYWKAYALTHAGRVQESLAALKKLEATFPSSRWLKDAQALSMQIRSDAGQAPNPAAEPDTDLKLLALNTLMQDDAHTALPALLRIINGTGSSKTREHALFVLAQSEAPEARKALDSLARQASNPALQMSAVRMMGMTGGETARATLTGLYKTSSDQSVKREILNGLMLSGSKSALLTVAQTEPDRSLRNSAITNLSLTGGQVELSELYKTATLPDAKREILTAFALTGDAKTLTGILSQEHDPELRAATIRSLGLLSSQASTLTALYRDDLDKGGRLAVLDALVAQQNGAALVELARKEKDPRLKAEIVRRMEAVRTPETRQYLQELVKQEVVK